MLNKKVISTFMVIVMLFTITAGIIPIKAYADSTNDLFFSEYIEGSSNNKAIEIFNGTSEAVDLSQYSVELYTNGSTTITNKITLSGQLENGDVYVIANSSAVADILNLKDITSSVTYFNGDDALVLKHNGIIIDVIGQVGYDPGTYWGTGDCTTLDHTLVRKPDVKNGDANPDDSFDPTIEWIGYAKDTFTYLGAHTVYLSVEEALNKAQGTVVTAMGYIVAPFNTQYAVKIADVNDASASTYLIVKLESDMRTEFSPVNNPTALGKRILVTGTRDVYSGLESIEYVTSIEFLEDGPDTEAPVIIHTPVAVGNIGADLNITAEVTDNRGVESVILYYRTIGAASYKSIVMAANINTYNAVIPKSELNTAGLEYYIEATDSINTITAPLNKNTPYQVVIENTDINGPQIISVQPGINEILDEANIKPEIIVNYADETGIDTSSIKLFVDGADITALAQVNADSITYIPQAELIKGQHNVRIELSDLLGYETTKDWAFYIGEPEYNLYFGQLHSHTSFSDGLGTIDEAYSYAKNTAKVDFLAVTDHSNSLDNASTCNISDGSKSTEWVTGHNTADIYTDSSFVGIYGYEMTWSNGTGHMNTFNTQGFETRDNAVYKEVDGLKKYYDVLKTVPQSISQFNHPGTTFGDFNDFAYYDPVIDNLITLIEVGNGEGAVGSSGYFPSYEYYTRALDKGWHVSPTNNQDNHLGKWGDANTARTVILSESLTRDSVYAAMRNMRTYATEDNNLNIKYTLNGSIMGTILGEKPDSINIKVDIADPDNEALGKISVISNGGIVAAAKSLSVGSDTVEFTLAPDYSYYYIRIDEADGDIAVTAPIWIGEVDKAGISKTTTNVSLPIKGESLIITSSLFNNEAYPMVVQSLTYSISGNTIHEAGAIDAVASLGTGSYSFNYTPPVAGKYNIDVKLTALINGVQKIFTDVLVLEVMDPSLVTKVIADGSHYNDYVTGYYANNLGNFITIANSEKIAANIEKTKLTDELLKDVKLLIISAPAKKPGTVDGISYLPQQFSDEDIAVVKRYVDNGGNLILCGIADYQDGTDVYQTSTQMNKLLEGVGATTRFNNDEVIDKTQNVSSTTYRLAFDDYNMTSPYLAGVQPGQTYSFYSGCSLALDEEALASGKTTWLVKGHDTTESMDSNSIVTGVSLPKGSVYALAVEQLNGGGKMFIGGTVFISNFEVKATLDNSTSLQNSNYNITLNILESVKNVIPVSPISEIRSAQNGSLYCAEGIVTAGKAIPDNSFFDTLYIQDATGGINVFPVSDTSISVGQRVKVIGTVDEYVGDKELIAISYEVTDTAVNPVEPTLMSTNNAMKPENAGLLIKVKGIVKSMDSQNLYIDDGSGIARVFVDGYIGDGSGDPTKAGIWDPTIAVGDMVSAIGLASVDTQGARLRVRNTAEIVKQIGYEGVFEWVQKPVSEISLNDTMTMSFIWSNADVSKTVRILIMNADNGSPIGRITCRDGITYNRETGEYSFEFEPADYNITSAARIKLSVIIIGENQTTITITVNQPAE